MAGNLVTIIGGSGFLGRHIARRMAKQGWRVRVAVRRPNEALFVRSYGDIGQVEPVQINIRDNDSIARAIAGSDVVVNTVGILAPDHKQNFNEVHHEAPARIAQLAHEMGIGQLVHISALGADVDAPSEYLRTKANGEQAVIDAFASALVVRPSLMFGGDADFLARFGQMARVFPMLGVVKPETRFQPVFVDDVAQFVVNSLEHNRSGQFDIGGEVTYTMREIFDYVSEETRRNRPRVNLPDIFAKLLAVTFDFLQFLTIGLFKNKILTKDQLRSLEVDNVVAGKDGLAAAKINPKRMTAIAPSYLEKYRERGEFEKLVKPRS